MLRIHHTFRALTLVTFFSSHISMPRARRLQGINAKHYAKVKVIRVHRYVIVLSCIDATAQDHMTKKSVNKIWHTSRKTGTAKQLPSSLAPASIVNYTQLPAAPTASSPPTKV